MTSDPRPAVILWDADGVLQDAAAGWLDRLTALGGPDFAAACIRAENDGPLVGASSFLAAVTALVGERKLAADPRAVADIWTQIEVFPDAHDLVARVRAAGTRCVLVTNQQDHRFAAMSDLGYPELMDALYPSCHVGAAKPDPAYFRTVLAAEGVAPEQALFIDDRTDNVEAAQNLGLRAARHDPSSGVAGLQAILRAHAVPI